MADPNAHPPTTKAGGADRAGRLTDPESTRPDVCADGYASHTLDRWLGVRGAQASPARTSRWVLAVDRPATFEELLELGLIDTDALAVPVASTDASGGGRG